MLITFLARKISCGINNAFELTFRRPRERTDVRQRNSAADHTRSVVNILVKNWKRKSHRASVGSSLEQTLRWASVFLCGAVRLWAVGCGLWAVRL